MDQSVSPEVSRLSPTPDTPPPLASQPGIGGLPRPAIWWKGRTRLPLRPRVLAIAAVVLLVLAYGGRELYLRWTHIYEYDARVMADIVTVSSRAEGWIVAMPALEGAKVAAGDVVVKIDDRVARLRVDAIRAQIEGVRAERTRLRAERRLFLDQTDAMARTRTSAVKARERAMEALNSDLELARIELERNRTLFERHVGNERALQQSQAAVTKLEYQLRQLRAEQEQAEGSLEEAKAEAEKLNVSDAQIAALDHQVANLAAQMHQQMVDVDERTIKSPVPAVIDRTFVLPGEYVASGQRILLLHDPSDVWIEANIKETQVGQIKLGQPVLVSVDAYPDEKFVGKVSLIGSATTARFALLPTPNPSGNFTKITQRVPVRVKMVDMPKPLTPGMMVEVDIDVR